MIARTQIVLGKTFKGIYKNSAKEGIGMYELKKHKAWFDEECFRFLD
jgi:hypothetical protein